jgi:sugar lactone lactonase YvrE
MFASTKGAAGSPDGSAVDLEGYLWNAEWGGSRVVRYAPDGRIDRVVEIPAQQPSSCCFGGQDLKTLYVTSAAEGLEKPGLSGSLFAFEPGVAGLALPLFDDLAEPEGPFAG